jgi:hypothetical protein
VIQNVELGFDGGNCSALGKLWRLSNYQSIADSSEKKMHGGVRVVSAALTAALPRAVNRSLLRIVI